MTPGVASSFSLCFYPIDTNPAHVLIHDHELHRNLFVFILSNIIFPPCSHHHRCFSLVYHSMTELHLCPSFIKCIFQGRVQQ